MLPAIIILASYIVRLYSCCNHIYCQKKDVSDLIKIFLDYTDEIKNGMNVISGNSNYLKDMLDTAKEFLSYADRAVATQEKFLTNDVYDTNMRKLINHADLSSRGILVLSGNSYKLNDIANAIKTLTGVLENGLTSTNHKLQLMLDKISALDGGMSKLAASGDNLPAIIDAVETLNGAAVNLSSGVDTRTSLNVSRPTKLYRGGDELLHNVLETILIDSLPQRQLINNTKTAMNHSLARIRDKNAHLRVNLLLHAQMLKTLAATLDADSADIYPLLPSPDRPLEANGTYADWLKEVLANLTLSQAKVEQAHERASANMTQFASKLLASHDGALATNEAIIKLLNLTAVSNNARNSELGNINTALININNNLKSSGERPLKMSPDDDTKELLSKLIRILEVLSERDMNDITTLSEFSKSMSNFSMRFGDINTNTNISLSMFSDMFKGLADALRALAEPLASVVSAGTGGVFSTLNTIVASATNTVSAAATTVFGALSTSITSSFSSLANVMGNTLRDITNTLLTELPKRIFKSMLDLFNALAITLPSKLLSGAARLLEKTLPQLVNMLVRAFLDLVGGITDHVTRNIAVLIEGLFKFLNTLLSVLWPYLEKLLHLLVYIITNLGEIIGKLIHRMNGNYLFLEYFVIITILYTRTRDRYITTVVVMSLVLIFGIIRY